MKLHHMKQLPVDYIHSIGQGLAPVLCIIVYVYSFFLESVLQLSLDLQFVDGIKIRRKFYVVDINDVQKH